MSVARHFSRLGFGLVWIAGNAAGYAVALGVWESLSRPLWPALSGFLGGSVTLALYGAAVGVGAGLAQALALRLRGAQAGRWVAATTISCALGFVVAAWVARVVSQNGALDATTDMIYRTSGRVGGVLFRESAVNLAFGLPIGASIGVARWRLLHTSGAAAIRWIPVSAVSFAFGFGMAVGFIQLVPPLPTAVFGALFGAYVGAITALIEWLWLRRRPKVWPLAGRPIEAHGAAVTPRP